MAVEFLTSAAILVLEIVAGRLLAPYVGVTLETTSAIIGTVLGGIALGTWVGGVLADRFDPGVVLPVMILLGGASSFATLPLVRTVAATATRGPAGAVALSAVGFFIPALVLSAVGPLLIRQQLRAIESAGRTVARISALGTVGAIFGSFVTGFYLVAKFSTNTIVNSTGLFLVILGLAVAVWGRALAAGSVMAFPMALAVGTGVISVQSKSVCDRETPYVCLSIGLDPNRPGGRELILDDLSHSYVDVDDPLYLEFDYVQSLGSTIDSIAPGGAPLTALHIGGGGFTIPRYIESTRPGSDNLILERDPDLVIVGREQLGFQTNDKMRVVLGDGRVTLRDTAPGTYDLVVTDAFGGEAAPWHLSTKEFLTDVKKRLKPGGVFTLNIIDGPSFGFVRAELNTLRTVYRNVVFITSPEALAGNIAANFVVIASDSPLPVDAIINAQAARTAELTMVRNPVDVDKFIGKSIILTDDFAPADQLFNP
jgi:spermidine synthase